VIAAIGTGIILTFLFGAVPRVLTREMKLLVSFPAADGISVNSPVLMRGVEIGRVIDKQLRDGDVLLTIGINSKYADNLSHEYVPKISTGSLITGDSKLEFVKATESELVAIHQGRLNDIRDQKYTDEQFLSYGIKSSDPFSLMFDLEDELRLTLQSVRSASGSMQSVGDNFDGLVDDARGVVGQANNQIGDVTQDARNALIEFQGAMRDIREVVGDPEIKASLSKSLAELPNVLTEAQTTLRSTQNTFDSFARVGQQFEEVGVAAEKTVTNVDKTVDAVRETVQSAKRSFASAERTVENVEMITKPIAENIDEIIEQTTLSLIGLRRTLGQVESLTTSINNSNGTVRRLLDDDDIYWQLRRTIENVEMATAQIRPILDDARIFSDKISRDPRQLGVRGALDRRGSGLGLK
jgi:phospholipid/cholesterol/gamma-HCH transport system substrate-binding protein